MQASDNDKPSIPVTSSPLSAPSSRLHLWDQLEGETRQAYAAFLLYRDLGRGRSMPTAYQQHLQETGRERAGNPAYVPRRWLTWSSSFQWVLRAGAWDAHLDEIAEQEKERLVRDEAARWAERYRQQREQEWEQADALLKQAQELLSFPLVEREMVKPSEDDPDQMVRIILKPKKWALRDAARFMEVASKLRSHAAGMPGLYTAVEHTVRPLSPDQTVQIYIGTAVDAVRTLKLPPDAAVDCLLQAVPDAAGYQQIIREAVRKQAAELPDVSASHAPASE